jgi:hypothetical protein
LQNGCKSEAVERHSKASALTANSNGYTVTSTHREGISRYVELLGESVQD